MHGVRWIPEGETRYRVVEILENGKETILEEFTAPIPLSGNQLFQKKVELSKKYPSKKIDAYPVE